MSHDDNAPIEYSISDAGDKVAELERKVTELEANLEFEKQRRQNVERLADARWAIIERAKSAIIELYREGAIAREDAESLAETIGIEFSVPHRLKGTFLVDIEIDAFASVKDADDFSSIIANAIENALNDEGDINVTWSEADVDIIDAE